MIAALAGRKAGPKRKCSLDAEKLHNRRPVLEVVIEEGG
jgi:hypothetical protein